MEKETIQSQERVHHREEAAQLLGQERVGHGEGGIWREGAGLQEPGEEGTETAPHLGGLGAGKVGCFPGVSCGSGC